MGLIIWGGTVLAFAGQNGLHKKKCNYFMLVLHAENSLLFQTNLNHNYKKEKKSSKYFKNKKNKNAYFALIRCNGAKWTTSLYTGFHFS